MDYNNEDNCNRCGKCCRVNLEIGNSIIPMKCEFLNDKDECVRYDDRPKWCLNPKQMKETGVMPILCGYNEKEVI